MNWIHLIVIAFASASIAQGQTPLIEFNFDEGNGTTAINTGTLGTGFNGSVNNATYSADTPSGTGTSLHFDGDSDLVTLPNTFNYSSDVTVEAWIKPELVDGQRVLG